MVSAALAAIVQAIMLIVLLLLLGYFGTDTNWLLLAAAVPLASFACAGIGMLTASFSRTRANYTALHRVRITSQNRKLVNSRFPLDYKNVLDC